MEHLTSLKKTVGIYARVAMAMMDLVPLQFTKSARYEIGRRDNWTCQNSGETFASGTMLHAAHYPAEHIRGHNDTNPAHGRMLSVREHLLEHVQMYLDEPSVYHEKSLELIAGLAYSNGYHTYAFYREHPGELERDRIQVIQDLADHGLFLGHEVSP